MFSERRLVEELIRGFFKEAWTKRLDFSTLERMSSVYVTDDLQAREGDLVWKLRFDDGRSVYICLLLEFQSTPDRYMAIRMMGYEALFYQELSKQGELLSGGKLPLVIPIVLYNGKKAWWPALDVADLIESVEPEADELRPRVKYRVIDERSYALEELEALRNVAAVLFWLEKTPEPEDVRRGIAKLVELLPGPADNGLRRAFAIWLGRVRIPGTGLKAEDIPEILGVEEFAGMLEQQVEDWSRVLLERGEQKGRQEGRQEGRKE
ncbi:MAG: Rpn family recombination-promoting nuclease/putative transposase, partial [bacterium]